MKHRDYCNGDCDEGRECWRGVLLSPEEAARRGIDLLDEAAVEELLREVNGSSGA